MKSFLFPQLGLTLIAIGLAAAIDDGHPIKNDMDGPPPPIKNSFDRKWNETDENGNYQVGDMIFTERQFKARYGTDEEKEAYLDLDRQGIPGSQYRWPNNELPYRFHYSVSSYYRIVVKNAIADFNSKLAGCFTIRYVDNDTVLSNTFKA